MFEDEDEFKEKSWIKRNPIIAGILGILLLVIVIGMFQGTDNKITGDVINEEIQEEILPPSYNEIKQKAIDVSYESLMRYSESYDGKGICFEGEIVQVISDIPNIELRVATKEDDWLGYIEEIIYLYAWDYEGVRLLEGDLIEFCGLSRGIATYEAIFGNQMSIPKIETNDPYLKLIEKVDKEKIIDFLVEEEIIDSLEEESDKTTIGEKNALSKALSYLDIIPFSYSGLIKQLEYEGYTTEQAEYGVDNCGADWNEQASLKAQSYLDIMPFSREGLIEQLEYEGYTTEQAEYGVQAVGY